MTYEQAKEVAEIARYAIAEAEFNLHELQECKHDGKAARVIAESVRYHENMADMAHRLLNKCVEVTG